MSTERLYFGRREVQILLPGLEALVNRFATAKLGSYPNRDPRFTIAHPEVSNVAFDTGMYEKVLYARNALKYMVASRQRRLDCWQIAAVQVALRLVRREKLVSDLDVQEFARLNQKLEKYRKRARRAAERVLGKDCYRRAAERWRLLLDWMHIHVFHFKPLRWSSPSNVLRRVQREQTRNLAISMVNPSIERARVIHLADLARREIRRGRHGFKLRQVLDDHARAVKFFTFFLLKRLGPGALRPEFQPAWYIPPEREERRNAVLEEYGLR